MAGSPTSKNLIAVVIGAVILFGAISVIPMYVLSPYLQPSQLRLPLLHLHAPPDAHPCAHPCCTTEYSMDFDSWTNPSGLITSFRLPYPCSRGTRHDKTSMHVNQIKHAASLRDDTVAEQQRGMQMNFIGSSSMAVCDRSPCKDGWTSKQRPITLSDSQANHGRPFPLPSRLSCSVQPWRSHNKLRGQGWI
ncbi:hypothetical protein BDW62DRAFT_80397 [Aspergillus aurantiobrunneus]